MKEHSKVTDTNVGDIEKDSIEEDVKILESIIKINNDYLKCVENQTINQKEIKALEHILSDYKRVLKENEELKEERQIVGIPVKNKRDGKIGIVLHQWESGSVAVLENINPRVINTHDSWNTLEIVTDEVKQTKTKCETILVQKVKDKIEQLKEKGESNLRAYGFAVDTHLALQALQKLLESEE